MNYLKILMCITIVSLSGCAKSNIEVYKDMKAESIMYCGIDDASTMINLASMKAIKCSNGKTYVFQEEKSFVDKLFN